MLAASGVETLNDPFHAIVLGTLEMVGRVAADPSELNRYGGLVDLHVLLVGPARRITSGKPDGGIGQQQRYGVIKPGISVDPADERTTLVKSAISVL